MKLIKNLDPELLGYLNDYKDWVLSARIQAELQKVPWSKGQFKKEGRPEYGTSMEFLKNLDPHSHEGFPPDLHGVDLNYKNLSKESARITPAFMNEARDINNKLDDNLQSALGARYCALKAYYPAEGSIAWHTNWNAPGYNIIFTYSGTGNGYWRHIDSTGSKSRAPNPEKLVHIPDTPGWHCKVGYFGSPSETDRIVWHSAYTNEPRVTVSYVVYDKAIWDNMVEDIEN